MTQYITFNQNVIMLGYGAVAQTVLPLLIEHLQLQPQQIIIIDAIDNKSVISSLIQQGLHYHIITLTRYNIEQVLTTYVKLDDLVIDLTYSVDTATILRYCAAKQVKYINTAIEEWPEREAARKQTGNIQEQALYTLQLELRELVRTFKAPVPTMIVEHGANPGLVSHFVKQALDDITYTLIEHDKSFLPMLTLSNQKRYPELAHALGVKVIHIAERDTQIISIPKKVNEFVGTWSIFGFYEEAAAPSELGWGTHEEEIPYNAIIPSAGPRNQIFLATRGMNTLVYSWVPAGDIVGMVIRHGESFSIPEYLTVFDGTKSIYRPSVYYVYCPCDASIASLFELKARHYKLQDAQRIIKNEIIDGQDQLGVLLMGHPLIAWWTGSLLDIHETRALVPHQNATTLQVAAGVVAAAVWAVQNPQAGYCLPDDLPHDEILAIAKPYLGPFISQQVDWHPLKYLENGFSKYSNTDALWQFKNFLVSD